MSKTQEQIYREEEKRIAQANEHFLQLAGLMPYPDGSIEQDPITQPELEKLIEKRPEKYSRFAGYLPQLRGIV